MPTFRIVKDPVELEGYPELDFPVCISINGNAFYAKEKIVVNTEDGFIYIDGALDGFFTGTVVVSRLWGIMSIV